MPDFNDTALETQLRRYLYLGKETPVFQPGHWFSHDYYEIKNIPSVEELAVNPLKHDVIISSIIETQEKELVQNPETLVFTLAVCAQQEKNEILRQKAYDAVQKICKSPEHFILFIKFCSKIKKESGTSKSGWGHGWRRVVKDWYLSKSPMELAKIVTQYKSRYGWKHKDIFKLAHITSTDADKKLIITYTMFGLEKAKLVNTGNPLSESQEELIKFFQSIEDFKHCEDENSSAAMIDSLDLSLDHVPGHMLKSEEVWNSLVSKMSLTEMLTNLQRVHNLGFLNQNGVILPKVIDLMTEQNVSKEKIHPAVFLVTLRNYENCGKPLSFEKRKMKEQAKKPLPPPPPVNKKVCDALNKLLCLSFLHIQPTNVHYMVAINTNKALRESGCWHSGNVNAAEAGALIALSLLRAEKSVIISTFRDDRIECIDVDVNSTLVQLMKKLEPTNVEIADLGKPILWAADKKKSVDVFINIVDQISLKSDGSEDAIKSYRSKMSLPNAKLVNCALCSSTVYKKESYDKNILSICGFDDKVPKIIEAFARSYF
ncbi:hypothetical protein QAD02_017224 [Eretmocerus hayati]|uniref:Uncharacterized protein n=1 Tax=Eretmocerus hayati TaxID=131215 RepID=A0ACC2PDA7_9HYME|nr:hypothetical protein QAD02_017224 [Eretmocerus hayati]